MVYTLPMATSILVTGGAASGKSVLAEGLTLALGRPAVYIATTAPADAAGDDEMAAKIAAHRARRGPDWALVEEPMELVGALAATDGGGPRLVDCLTLWLSNLMFAGRDPDAEADALGACLPGLVSPVVFVSNEVGSGIVPDNALARRFRNAAGRLNQHVAAVSDEVWLSVSGCPLRIKPR